MATDDDDPADDWADDDTGIDLEQSDLDEMEADATTPTVGPEAMPGYELGRAHERAAFFRNWDAILAQQEARGVARVLLAVRGHLEADGAEPGIADDIVRALARRVGVRLG